GRIWMESDEGAGAIFHFTIQVWSAAAATPAWQSQQPQLAGKRLLVIEDNATNRKLITHRAAQWGMGVECAADSTDALKRLREGADYDAAIVDLQLPDKDGLTLAAEMRALPSGNSLPILLLSSVRLRSDDERPARVGISIFVHKPIRPAQLFDAVCRALNVQLQREKKAPSIPSLDPGLSQRFPLRVLLADDNPINQRVGVSILRKLGYRADVANNGLEVLHALERKAYDIIFLDVQMPDMDGLETTRQICERWPREKRPCIVAMTGNALLGDREKCIAAGMDDYITKPVRIPELQEIIERWGPSRKRKFETSFLLRSPVPSRELLIDDSILSELSEMPSENGVSIVRELVDLFLESAPERMTQIASSLNDPAQLAFHAHALKSMALNLGAKRLVEISQRLEAMGRSGDMADAAALSRELETAFSQTKVHLLPLRGEGLEAGS
ncbi:MAG TPA: response regulator, partial [Verrucomicrobiae bacterium]|nr:response regulator [Verrucomicrobiae bacterium]